MFKKVKVAILGAGNVAKHYRNIFKKIPNTSYEIVGICDIDENAASLLASDFGCRHFNDINFLLLKAAFILEKNNNKVSKHIIPLRTVISHDIDLIRSNDFFALSCPLFIFQPKRIKDCFTQVK